MVEDYQRMFYAPATEAYAKLTADNAEYAKSLVRQKEEYVKNFDGNLLHIEQPTVDRPLSDVHVGDTFQVTTRRPSGRAETGGGRGRRLLRHGQRAQ